MMHPVNSLRQTLKDIRNAVGLTQEEIGKRCGRDQHWVSRVERSKNLEVDDLELWARACGLQLVIQLVPDHLAALLQAIITLPEADQQHLARIVGHLKNLPLDSKQGWETIVRSFPSK